MNTSRCLLIVALLGAVPAIAADPSNGAGLTHCAGINAPTARLACYDALAGRTPEPARTADAASAATLAPTTKEPAAASAANEPANFGLSQAQIHKTPEGPAAIQARVLRIGAGQSGGRSYVVLDNGQTWVFTDKDQDRRLRSGDLVTIRRAALGSFMLTAASKRSYHVRRSQ